MSPSLLFTTAWVLWALSWLAAAAWTARTEAAVPGSRGDVWLYRVLVLAGFVLVNPWASQLLGKVRLWHVGLYGAYALAGVTIAGLLFTWWARLHLGRLWSSAVTRKEGHRIVDTGPYALVRHPIYCGLLVATLATAGAIATWPALAGAACVAAGFWVKASIEERFLAAEIGQDAYQEYRRRVPMLLPFPPRPHRRDRG